MIHLLLSTLAMMGLTFLIGFFVAAVIKLIAYAADSFDFYSSHRLELLRLRRWRQHRQKVERLVRQIPIADEDALGANISGVITSAIITGIYITIIPYL